jgi:arylformamidase
MIGFGEVLDVSLLWGEECAAWPGEEAELRTEGDAGAGGQVVTSLRTSVHYGTHLDAPAHFIAGGRTIDGYAAAEFILPAVVLDIAGDGDAAAADLAGADLRSGDAVLFRTRNSRQGISRSPVFREDFAGVGLDAARLLAGLGARLAGIDYLSIERTGDGGYPVHRLLLGAGVLILEGLNLAAVAPGRYTLVCLPLRLKSAEGSPVRAVLLR